MCYTQWLGGQCDPTTCPECSDGSIKTTEEREPERMTLRMIGSEFLEFIIGIAKMTMVVLAILFIVFGLMFLTEWLDANNLKMFGGYLNGL